MNRFRNPTVPSLLLTPDGAEGVGAGAGAGAGAAGTQTPADTGDKITLTKAEYEGFVTAKGRLADVEKKATDLEADWKHVSRLMKAGDNDDPAAVKDSIVAVMRRAGHSQSEIDAYIAEQDTPSNNGRGNSKPGAKGGESDPELETLKKGFGDVNQRMAVVEKERLVGILDQNLSQALDGDKGLGTLVRTLAGLQAEGAEEIEQRRSELLKVVREEIKRETLDNLRTRRAQNRGEWNEGWIREEAVKAAKAVDSKYRSFVGDPAKLGRTPETGAGEDFLKNQKPVEAPTWKKGMDSGSVDAAVTAYTVDQLLRMSNGSAGAGTKA